MKMPYSNTENDNDIHNLPVFRCRWQVAGVPGGVAGSVAAGAGLAAVSAVVGAGAHPVDRAPVPYLRHHDHLPVLPLQHGSRLPLRCVSTGWVVSIKKCLHQTV